MRVSKLVSKILADYLSNNNQDEVIGGEDELDLTSVLKQHKNNVKFV